MAEAKIRVTVEDRASAALEGIGRSVSRLEALAGAQALLGFGTTIARWAEEGDRASDVFGALAYDLEGLQRATAGTVDAMTLATIANRAMAAGLNLTQRELEAVVAAGTEYARVTGTDATAGTERLLGALVSGRERGLRPFGISTTDTGQAIAQLVGRLDQNRVALDRNSGAFDRASAQVADLRTEFQRLAADGVEAFLAAIGLVGSRTEAEMSRALSAAESFAARFNAIAVRIGTALGFREGMTAEQASFWAGTAEGRAALRQRGIRTQAETDIFLRGVQRQGGNVREVIERMPITSEGQAEIDAGRRAARQRERDADRDARIERAGIGWEPPSERRRGGGGGGGGGRRDDSERQAREDARARDEGAMEAWAEELEDLQARGVSAPAPQTGGRRESNTSVGRARRSDGPSDRNGLRAATREVVSLEAAYEQLGSTATDVLDALGTAVAGHFEAWAMGRETMGEALAGMTADLFKWMGQQALKKAGMEAIEAIAAAARYDFGAAALHTAAAVGFGALAGGSFYVAGQVGGSSGRSTHGRDERSSTRDLGADRSLGGQGFGGPSVTINIAPGGIIGPDAAEVVGRLAVDGVNRGIRLGGMPRFDSSAIRTSGSRA